MTHDEVVSNIKNNISLECYGDSVELEVISKFPEKYNVIIRHKNRNGYIASFRDLRHINIKGALNET